MSRVPFLTIALSASTMATVLPAAAALHSTRTAFFFAQPLFELKALLPNLRTRHQTCNFSPSLSLRRFSSLRQRNLSPMAMSDAAPTAEATGTPLPSQNILQRGPTVVSERKETPFQRFDTLSTVCCCRRRRCILPSTNMMSGTARRSGAQARQRWFGRVYARGKTRYAPALLLRDARL